jgi:hypothetical protein
VVVRRGLCEANEQERGDGGGPAVRRSLFHTTQRNAGLPGSPPSHSDKQSEPSRARLRRARRPRQPSFSKPQRAPGTKGREGARDGGLWRGASLGRKFGAARRARRFPLKTPRRLATRAGHLRVRPPGPIFSPCPSPPDWWAEAGVDRAAPVVCAGRPAGGRRCARGAARRWPITLALRARGGPRTNTLSTHPAPAHAHIPLPHTGRHGQARGDGLVCQVR